MAPQFIFYGRIGLQYGVTSLKSLALAYDANIDLTAITLDRRAPVHALQGAVERG
jgi:hypothetical protein